MNSKAIIMPTYNKHHRFAYEGIELIRAYSNVAIYLVISRNEVDYFYRHLDNFDNMYILYLEDALTKHLGLDISSDDLLRKIGKFRFQSLKKLLGVVESGVENCLVIDSETRILKGIDSYFDDDIVGNSVVYSERDLNEIGLIQDVMKEVNFLLGQPYNNLYFFENYNWFYKRSIVSDMLQHLAEQHGREWMLREKHLFECQLYYHYAFKNGVDYRFITVLSVLAEHFGEEAGIILERFNNSQYRNCGVLEYLAAILSKHEYFEFISNENVIQHLRLLRHEPAILSDVYCGNKEQLLEMRSFYGEASMHRGIVLRSKVAILLSGEFRDDVEFSQVKSFLSTVESDVFVSCSLVSPYASRLSEIPGFKSAFFDDNYSKYSDFSFNFDEYVVGNKEEDLRTNRDLGTSIMFSKMLNCHRVMEAYEKESNVNYDVVVRLRPGIITFDSLKDIFDQILEHHFELNDKFFIPNSFWSQGLNDQFYISDRSVHNKIMFDLQSNHYWDSDYINPEYYLAKIVENRSFGVFCFKFKYLLSRGDSVDVEKCANIWTEQQRNFWSRTHEADVSINKRRDISSKLNNIKIKNFDLKDKHQLENLRGDRFDLIPISNNNYLVSEYKSGKIFKFEIAKISGVFPEILFKHDSVILKSYSQHSKALVVGENDNQDCEFLVCDRVSKLDKYLIKFLFDRTFDIDTRFKEGRFSTLKLALLGFKTALQGLANRN